MQNIIHKETINGVGYAGRSSGNESGNPVGSLTFDKCHYEFRVGE